MVNKTAAKKKSVKKATAKRKPARKASAVKAIPSVDLQHRLDALLHTMRCIAQHEDELCTLLHDARRTGRMNASLLRELRTLLQELPREEYLHDLYAVQQVVEPA